MTRRMIDSSMWSNENFAALPAMARLLQVGIINHADDQGRIKAHPAYLRSQIFPYDDVTVADVDKWLYQIVANGTILVYRADDGKDYIQLLKWWDYQSLQYAAPSEYAAPVDWLDRIRYNAKGGMVLTFNWATTKGEMLPDTCDQRGVIITKPLEARRSVPPEKPPGSPPEKPPGNINKEQLNTNKEQLKTEAEGATPPAAAVPSAQSDVCRLWEKWDSNMPGTKTPVIVDSVNALLNDFGIAEIEEAITIACKQNKRSLRYIEGILAKGAFSERPQPSGGDYRSNHRGSNRQSNTARSGQSDGGDTPQLDPDIQRRMDEHRAKRKAEGSRFYQ